MSKRTPYAVLAKLVEELNEENEKLQQSLAELTAALIGESEFFREKLDQFVRVANEMNELLYCAEARRLATPT